MAKPRVHEIAADMHIDSKRVLEELNKMGEFVKGPSSSLQPPVARKVRARLLAANGDLATNVTSSAIQDLKQEASPTAIAEVTVSEFATGRAIESSPLDSEKGVSPQSATTDSRLEANQDRIWAAANSGGTSNDVSTGFSFTNKHVAASRPGEQANPLMGQPSPTELLAKARERLRGRAVPNRSTLAREEQADNARRRLITRRDARWSKYGITKSEQKSWVSFGLREDQAHIAAMCRAFSGRDNRISEPTLRATLPNGQTVLEQFSTGANVVEVLALLAAARSIEFIANFDQRIVPALVPDLFERNAAKPSPKWPRDSGPTAVPKVAEFLFEIFGATALDYTVQRIRRERDVFLSSGRTGAMLKLYAQAHGIFEEPTLVARLLENLPGFVSEVAHGTQLAELTKASVEDRHFYHLSPEAASRAKQLAAELDFVPELRDHLPPSGFALLEGGKQALSNADVLMWSFKGSELAARSVSLSKLARGFELESDQATSGIGESVRTPDDESARLVLAIAKLISQPSINSPMAGKSNRDRHGRTVKSHSRSKSESTNSQDNDFVALVYAPHEIRPPIGTSRTGRPAENRWIVQGHWRRQWYPSKNERQRIWIEAHEAGAIEGIVVDRDRVRVLK